MQIGLAGFPVALATAVGLMSAGLLRASTFIETVALTGDAAPGGPEGAVFLEFGASVINDHGSTAFLAARQPGVGGVTADDALGTWRRTAGVVTPVTVGDPPAPGVPGAMFDLFNNVAQLSDSEAVFQEFKLKVGIGGVDPSNDVGGWLFTEAGAELVFREGDSLPGMHPDAELSFGFPRMNGAGEVAIGGRFRTGVGGVSADNDQGVWIKSAESFDLVARAGDWAPGLPAGALLDTVGLNDFNDNGVIVSRGMLVEGVGGVTSANSQVVLTNRTGAFALEYRESDLTDTGQAIDSFQSVVANEHNRLAFDVNLKQGIGGVGVFNNRGIWVETDTGLRQVVRTDDPMPGVAGRDFRGFSNLLLNDAGHVAFAASSGSSIGFDSIFSEGIDGVLKLVAREFRAAPGTQEGVLFDFDHIEFIGIPKLAMNNAGQVAFLAGLTGTGVTAGNDFGLWAQDPAGTLHLIAREGDSIEVAPGDSRVVQRLNFGGLNDAGQIVFDTIFTDATSGVFISSRVAPMSDADFDEDGDVDGADLLVWQRGLGLTGQTDGSNGDANRDALVDGLDLEAWRNQFGRSASESNAESAVPEPAGLVLLGAGVVGIRRLIRRQR